MKWLKSIFSGGGVVDAIEGIATEWIETDLEKAEAKTVMIKALDPNGAMRRQISRDVAMMYKTYLFVSLALLTIEFLCGIFSVKVDYNVLSNTTENLTDLFLPISSLFGVIVTASFGVNYTNIKSNK